MITPSFRTLFGTLPVLALGLVASVAQAAPRIDLDAFEKRVHSIHGEEGVLEKIFEIIEPTHKYAVEFGAYDGILRSNTRYLIAEHGWGGFQIEGHEGRAEKLAKLYADNDRVTTQQAWIFPGNIEYLFERAGVPKDLDLLIIDIDSNDYWVWKAITEYRPKVVMIEANHNFVPPQRAVIEFHPFNYWDKETNYGGASMQSFYDLAKRKGYELVHQMKEGSNIIFVEKSFYDRFGIEDNSPTAMFRPRRKVPLTVEEATTYPRGKDVLPVDAFVIEKRWLLDY